MHGPMNVKQQRHNALSSITLAPYLQTLSSKWLLRVQPALKFQWTRVSLTELLCVIRAILTRSKRDDFPNTIKAGRARAILIAATIVAGILDAGDILREAAH